ncbi:MAG: hypothetical protein K1X79_06480 [Oligoflexia bacterium]|nr:hypothetical protein [Oligoflexia bacterium]
MFSIQQIRCVALHGILLSGILVLDASADTPRLPNAKMTYKSEFFHIPVLPPFSDGTGKKTAKDCEELDRRLKAEKGEGVVTYGAKEFASKLDALCARMGNDYPNYARVVTDPVSGKRCIEAIWTECTVTALPQGTPDAPLRNWCEFWINNISVKNSNEVTVEFDVPTFPCDCQGKSRIIDCLDDEEVVRTGTKQTE